MKSAEYAFESGAKVYQEWQKPSAVVESHVSEETRAAAALAQGWCALPSWSEEHLPVRHRSFETLDRSILTL